MTWSMRSSRAALGAATLAGSLLGLPQNCPAAAQSASSATDASVSLQAGNPAAADAVARLDKKQFRDATIHITNSKLGHPQCPQSAVNQPMKSIVWVECG
jgi:hypothetical protein